MVARRSFLRRAGFAVLVPFVAACSQEAAPEGASGSSARGESATTRHLATSLGAVELVTVTDVDFWSDRIERAARQVASVWGRGTSITVRVCDDAEFAEAADGLDAGSAAVTTPRGVFVGPGLRRAVTPEGAAVVLAHELTHARLGHHGSDHTQWWLKEGAAEWTAAGTAPALSARQRWPDLMTALAASAVPDGPPDHAHEGTNLGYEWAHAYVEYLVEQDGRASVQELVRARPADATQRVRGRGRALTFTAWLRHQAHVRASASTS